MSNRESKVLCSEDGCYKEVTIDILTERMADGTVHPLALKCYSCTTDQDIKRLKRFRKNRSKAKRKQLELTPLKEPNIK